MFLVLEGRVSSLESECFLTFEGFILFHFLTSARMVTAFERLKSAKVKFCG